MPDFLIQRFSYNNHPHIRGERPFIVRGPNMTAYTTTQTLADYEWKFRQSFVDDIGSIAETSDRLSREVAAELLLTEGIVQALWAVNGERPLPEDQRWRASIVQLADEIPVDGRLDSGVIELLSGIAEPAHCRSYLLDTGLILEPVAVPG